MRHVLTTVFTGVLLVSGLSCGDSTGPKRRRFFSYVSSPGDFVGGGESHSYTNIGNWTTKFSLYTGTIEHIHISIDGLPGGASFQLDFASPPGIPLAVGSYPDAHRFPFEGDKPGLAVSGFSRGCNNITGSFTITALTIGPGNVIKRLDVTFQQNCENTMPPLTGELSFVGN